MTLNELIDKLLKFREINPKAADFIVESNGFNNGTITVNITEVAKTEYSNPPDLSTKKQFMVVRLDSLYDPYR